MQDVYGGLVTLGRNRLLATAIAAVGRMVIALRRRVRMNVQLRARCVCAVLSTENMPGLPKGSPDERPSISRSGKFQPMLIRETNRFNVPSLVCNSSVNDGQLAPFTPFAALGGIAQALTFTAIIRISYADQDRAKMSGDTFMVSIAQNVLRPH